MVQVFRTRKHTSWVPLAVLKFYLKIVCFIISDLFVHRTVIFCVHFAWNKLLSASWDTRWSVNILFTWSWPATTTLKQHRYVVITIHCRITIEFNVIVLITEDAQCSCIHASTASRQGQIVDFGRGESRNLWMSVDLYFLKPSGTIIFLSLSNTAAIHAGVNF